jgi:hypothetical protein
MYRGEGGAFAVSPFRTPRPQVLSRSPVLAGE